jgi:ABC-type transport system substrate-binding protein
MTAEDVVYSYQQWAQNAPHSDNAEINREWNNPAGSVETPDSHTVVVNTGDPVADVILYQFLASAGGSPTRKVSRRQSEELGVESTRLASFHTGNRDTFIMAFDSIPLVEQVPGAKFMRVANAGPMMIQFFGNYYVGIGTPEQRGGYDPSLPWVSASPDVVSPEWERARKVRQVLMAAIDTEAIIETLLRDFGRLAVLHDYVGNEHLLDPDMEWEYDPERAAELLADTGYPGGGLG